MDSHDPQHTLPDEATKAFLSSLTQQLGQERATFWFNANNTAFRWTETELVIGVPNAHCLDFLRTHYLANVRFAAEQTAQRALQVRFEVDPALFQRHRAKTAGAAESSRRSEMLLDFAPLPPIDLSDEKARQEYFAGLRHEILSLPDGEPVLVRFVGEMVPLFIHYVGGRDRPCFGRICLTCESEDPRRVEPAYADVIRCRKVDRDTSECFRVVQQVPQAAHYQLRRDGAALRGRLYRFEKQTGGKPTRVQLVDERCPYPLEDPIDVRKVLVRRYGLKKFPDQRRGEGPPNGRKRP